MNSFEFTIAYKMRIIILIKQIATMLHQKIQKLCQLQVDKPDTNSAPKMTYLQIWSV